MKEAKDYKWDCSHHTPKKTKLALQTAGNFINTGE
jgi:hypothetical protein